MKVLIVCRQKQSASPFIVEQVDAIRSKGVEFEYFFIQGKGIVAYISAFSVFNKHLKIYKPDIIHAHYGLSGFFANFQRRFPVVTTYHGSDINNKKSKPISQLTARRSKYNIFVSGKIAQKAGIKKKFMIQPCGINMNIFQPSDKQVARKKMRLESDKIYVLFSSAFSNRIKNANLAKESIKLSKREIELLELKGYSREEVNLLLNACDVALLTSFAEGSPQFIKEAMACNCPIVSTDVGSVKEILDSTEGCYVAKSNPVDVSNKLEQAILFGKRTNGYQKIIHLSNEIVAERIINVYKSILPSTSTKVLFVCREKRNGENSPIIEAQANSLKGLIDILIYGIPGKGWKSYINGIFSMRKRLKSIDVGLVHAHFSYTGMVAGLATRKPIVMSLMGSDIEGFWFGRMLIRLFANLKWKAVIVKSERSKKRIGLRKAYVIPNGVDLQKFRAVSKEEARKKLGLDPAKIYVLFLSHPDRKEKNYKLAVEGCRRLSEGMRLGLGSWELKIVYGRPHSEIPLYLSAADTLLLTSFFEGSPNVIKEAMACNCPIVSTDVGDVKELIGGTEGCYITSFDSEDVATKLKKALDFGKRTNGRNKIQHLDSKIIAQKLLVVYESLLS